MPSYLGAKFVLYLYSHINTALLWSSCSVWCFSGVVSVKTESIPSWLSYLYKQPTQLNLFLGKGEK